MADDQDPSREVDENGDAPEISDYDDTTVADAVIADQSTTLPSDDYDDGPIEDYVVKMVVDEQPDGALIDVAVTDLSGNVISQNTKIYDAINTYSTAIYDELNGNATAITGGKRWWGKFIIRKQGKKARNTSIYVCVCKCVYAFATS